MNLPTSSDRQCKRRIQKPFFSLAGRDGHFLQRRWASLWLGSDGLAVSQSADEEVRYTEAETSRDCKTQC